MIRVTIPRRASKELTKEANVQVVIGQIQVEGAPRNPKHFEEQ